MWDDACSRCGNALLWWRSRTGYRVCMTCTPDPLEALAVLARRAGSDAVQQVQRLRGASAPATGSKVGKSRGDD
jgi:hypothetical protein